MLPAAVAAHCRGPPSSPAPLPSFPSHVSSSSLGLPCTQQERRLPPLLPAQPLTAHCRSAAKFPFHLPPPHTNPRSPPSAMLPSPVSLREDRRTLFELLCVARLPGPSPPKPKATHPSSVLDRCIGEALVPEGSRKPDPDFSWPRPQVAKHCLAKGDDDIALRVFEIFSDLVETSANVLQPQLPALVSFSVEVANPSHPLLLRCLILPLHLSPSLSFGCVPSCINAFEFGP